MATTKPFVDGKLRYPIEECIEVLGVSRRHFFAQIKTGAYQVVKDGSRTFMTRDALVAASKGTAVITRPPHRPDCGRLGAKKGHKRCVGKKNEIDDSEVTK